MKQVAVIFNGLHFPHHVAEYAISGAREASAGLLALFIVAREKEEGYFFPNDLDAAQDLTDKEDAEQDDLRIIRSQVHLLEGMAKMEGVACTTGLLVDPALQEVLSGLQDADTVIVGKNDHSGLMSVKSFDMADLLSQLPSSTRKVVI